MKSIELQEVRHPTPPGPVRLTEQKIAFADLLPPILPPRHLAGLPPVTRLKRLKHPRLQVDKGLQVDQLA